ncbi:helix-turn-helix domain-containing protein [Leptospira sp. WS58.C1]|uniref:helix-turn-helix domain-containing protein n=1 Tax=Leptospira TaxID=171 RepID=UPI0002BF90F3|nr:MULTISPECIES: helix-turn-helix transcriptional regulator [unclassified Leptospira]EMJ97120.1 DNA-binding helix-turn-helix protein [Leptospira sp. B5-022]MCR1792948.1 helix-turn-helix transcriptional regulator [Leptospira sp. id769339]
MSEHYDFLTLGLEEQALDKLALMRIETDAVMKTADLISNAMQGIGINQKELAERLQVTPGYISRLLGGSENVTVKQVAKVLYALGKRYVQESCPLGFAYFRDYVRYETVRQNSERETNVHHKPNLGWAEFFSEKEKDLTRSVSEKKVWTNKLYESA